MSEIKSIIIRTPKKTFNNKKLVINKNNITKINHKLNPIRNISNKINPIRNISNKIIKSHITNYFNTTPSSKRNNLRKSKYKHTIRKERNLNIYIDSKHDVVRRIDTKKKHRNTILNMSKNKIKNILIKKGIIKSSSKAPKELLLELYLNSKLLGDINIIK